MSEFFLRVWPAIAFATGVIMTHKQNALKFKIFILYD